MSLEKTLRREKAMCIIERGRYGGLVEKGVISHLSENKFWMNSLWTHFCTAKTLAWKKKVLAHVCKFS